MQSLLLNAGGRRSNPSRNRVRNACRSRRRNDSAPSNNRICLKGNSARSSRDAVRNRNAEPPQPGPEPRSQRENPLGQGRYSSQQGTQQQAAAWQQQRGWAQQGGWQEHSTWQQNRAQHWQSDHRTWGQRGGYGGYVIPEDRFRFYFGSQHGFRLENRPIIVGGYPRFQYGAYWFMLVNPWPEYWAQDGTPPTTSTLTMTTDIIFTTAGIPASAWRSASYREGGLQLNHAEFIDVHTSGVTALRAYFDQAEKTTKLLAKCTAEPLPFADRLVIASQEIAENTAHSDYLGIKRRLHYAARLGYERDF